MSSLKNSTKETTAKMEQNDLKSILTSNWGPTDDAIPSFSGLPFVPYSKGDSINYIANWDPNKINKRPRQSTFKKSATLDAQNLAELGVFSDEDAQSYTSECTNNDGWHRISRHDYNPNHHHWHAPSKKHKKRKLQAKEAIFNNIANKITNTAHHHSKKQQLKQKKWKKQRENPLPNEFSITPKDSWINTKEIWFRNTFNRNGEYNNQILKGKKILLAGRIHGVLTKYDGTRYQPQLLQAQRFKNIEVFDGISATQDPYIMELVRKKKGNVYTTDNVISAIMCCERSKYSFDIIVNKIGDTIFLDERDKGLSGYSVDETSPNRSTKYKKPAMDYYTSLSQEATRINHVFKEQLLYQNNLEYQQKLKRSHPFKDISTKKTPSSQGFSYNLFQVTNDIQVMCRCSIDGYIANPQKSGSRTKDWVNIYALNQYNNNKQKTTNWRKNLDKKEVTIIKQEIRNNSFKCARWGIKSSLSDCKYIKLGFIDRERQHLNDRHEIIGVKTYQTTDYLKQIGIRSMRDSWNIFLSFIEEIKRIDGDGRFIVVRDAFRGHFKVYSIHYDAFKDDGVASFGELKKILNV